MPKKRRTTGYISGVDMKKRDEKPKDILEFSIEETRETKAGNKVNWLVFLGKIRDEPQVEWEVPDFVIENLNEVIDKVGEDWTGKKFHIYQIEGKVYLEPV